MTQVALLNRANLYLVPMGGYPLTLAPNGASVAEGVVTSRTTSVIARLYAETQADVHLGLYQAPLTRGGADGRLIAQTDFTGLGGQIEEISVAPTAPADTVEEQDGEATATDGSTAVTGSATAFPTDGSWVGLELQIGGSLWMPIASVASATALTLLESAPATASGVFRVRVPPPRAYVFRLWIDNVRPSSVEYTRDDSDSVSAPGTVDTTSGSNIVTGTSTAFASTYAGYSLTIGSQTFTIAEVYSATRLRTVEYATSTSAAASYSMTTLEGVDTTEPGRVIVESIKVA